MSRTDAARLTEAFFAPDPRSTPQDRTSLLETIPASSGAMRSLRNDLERFAASSSTDAEARALVREILRGERPLRELLNGDVLPSAAAAERPDTAVGLGTDHDRSGRR